jgi:nicotinate-nucleotide pyrophosphorylase (carboxylating)
MTTNKLFPIELITTQVQQALAEDIGQADLTADLIPVAATATASLITRETMTLSGQQWLNEVFRQLDPTITITWKFNDGDKVSANAELCTLVGNARQLLTGERTAMNFVQTLSATATQASQYADIVKDLPVKILDTRKTLPGFRLAQKYAVTCGGGHNHRIGLFDGVLIKENHINAAGSIKLAVSNAKQLHPDVEVEVEVENFDELDQAIEAGADIIMLDNFDILNMKKAVEINQKRAELEASGGINFDTVRAIAETGVDRISIGAITKDIQAIDLSMRFK